MLQGSSVYVIDEIGKMELFSQSFCRTVQHLLDDHSNTVFCTIPVAKGKPLPLVEQLRNRKDIILYQVCSQELGSSKKIGVNLCAENYYD